MTLIAARAPILLCVLNTRPSHSTAGTVLAAFVSVVDSVVFIGVVEGVVGGVVNVVVDGVVKGVLESLAEDVVEVVVDGRDRDDPSRKVVNRLCMCRVIVI